MGSMDEVVKLADKIRVACVKARVDTELLLRETVRVNRAADIVCDRLSPDDLGEVVNRAQFLKLTTTQMIEALEGVLDATNRTLRGTRLSPAEVWKDATQKAPEIRWIDNNEEGENDGK